MAEVRERAVWQGEVVTVIERTATGAKIRDAYGYLHNIRKRDLKPLRDDDERKRFIVKGENE